MNALEFLIANADRVLDVYYGNVHETAAEMQSSTVDVAAHDEYQDEFNTDVCFQVREGKTPTVFFCPELARDLKLQDFESSGSYAYETPAQYHHAVAAVTEKSSLYSFSIDEPVSDDNADLCMSVERLIQLMRIVSDADRNENRKFYYRAGTSGYVRTKAVYTIRKSVLLKEAGGSTAEEGHVSLAEPGKNSFRPASISITILKPDMQDGEYSRRIRVHGAAKIAHFTPEIAAPYGQDADKQYSEEHAKQLASLDALIASPSMPDACKTLLRGCRHQFERADTYDQLGGERSMDKIVPMFNILYGKDLTKEQGWMFMMLVKAVRSANGNYSADSYEDGGSYWGLADEDAKKERK